MSDDNLWNKFLGWVYPKLVEHMVNRGFGPLWMKICVDETAGHISRIKGDE